MSQSFFEQKQPARLGRPPPTKVQTTRKWLTDARRKHGKRGSAPARQEGPPPTFTIASPRSGEGRGDGEGGRVSERFDFIIGEQDTATRSSHVRSLIHE